MNFGKPKVSTIVLFVEIKLLIEAFASPLLNNIFFILTDKVFTLEEEISLTDFLGVENSDIKEVASAFPLSKIISRGNQILIKGNTDEINRIADVLEAMIAHLRKYKRISVDQLKSYIKEDS